MILEAMHNHFKSIVSNRGFLYLNSEFVLIPAMLNNNHPTHANVCCFYDDYKLPMCPNQSTFFKMTLNIVRLVTIAQLDTGIMMIEHINPITHKYDHLGFHEHSHHFDAANPSFVDDSSTKLISICRQMKRAFKSNSHPGGRPS